jgi:DHA1 family multidrug resistance protein-like MFS transporter
MRQTDWQLQRRTKSGRLPDFIGTFVIAGLNISALGAARLVLPLIALSMGASAVLAGAIAASFTVAPMLLSIPYGRWVDRVGTLLPIIGAALFIVVAAVIFWLSPGKYTLLVIAALIGAGGVFAHIAGTRAVGGESDETNRARNLGYLVLSYSLFQFTGPIAASAVYQYYGATAAIGALGGFALLSILGIALRVHFFKRERTGASPRAVSPRAYQLLSIGSLRSWILLSSAFVSAQAIYPFVVSLHTVAIGLSAIEAGWLLAAFAVGTFVSRFFTPLLTKHFKARIILTVALILSALIYALIPFVQDIRLLSALSCALALPLGVGAPVSLVMIYESAPEGRVNESIGLSMAVNNLLQTLFPLILGGAVASFGVAPMVLAFAAAMVAAALLNARQRQSPAERD